MPGQYKADMYKPFAQAFEEYFSSERKALPVSPQNLYEPVTYFLELDGKRLRPLLVLIAADCFKGEIKKALPAAAAVELFHNFSLIHDDIMDKAPLRRGKATVHEKWNSNIAILSGDVLLVKAYQQIAESECAKKLLDVFSRTAIQVCEGQQDDMDFEGRQEVTMREYLEMIRLKTAVLLACSLQMGALCAGADPKQANGFYTAGEKLGMAFQLTDDHLDVFGDPLMTGKQAGGDIISNKKTWLLIKAFELADAGQKAILKKWTDKKEYDVKEKINAVKNIFTELDLSSLLEKEINSYCDQAFAELRVACPNSEKTETFISFIKTLMRREK